MAIETDMVMSISPESYCKIHGLNIDDYVVRGVHCSLNYDELKGGRLPAMLAETAPQGTEAILDYQVLNLKATAVYVIAWGTALIPELEYLKAKEGLNDQFREGTE